MRWVINYQCPMQPPATRLLMFIAFLVIYAVSQSSHLATQFLWNDLPESEQDFPQRRGGEVLTIDGPTIDGNVGINYKTHHEERILFRDDTESYQDHRRLSEEDNNDSNRNTTQVDSHWSMDIPHILSMAKSPPQSNHTPLRVLIVMTSLVEYDKGTRGTTHGYDRLQYVALPPLVDSVTSMTSLGWQVDVYLILGYASLLPERRQMIQNALPDGVGLQVWEDASPLHYEKTYAKRPKEDQTLSMADHALSRQHRFVLRDKLPFYDFFVCFEDDIRVTANNVINFLELSSDIHELHRQASSSPDNHAHVLNQSPSRPNRHKPNDGASVGNDIVDDPISAEHIKRLFPGLLRVEVLDRNTDHPLRRNGILNNHLFSKEVPPSPDAFTSSTTRESLLDPTICCDENDPPRGRMTAHPTIDEVVLWETNIQATGVRKYPHPIGWAAVMPVEDRADVGSYWSGFPNIYGTSDMKRPRRIDATIGNQAGFMATRSQIEYFHNVACPGGFLPPYDSSHWRGDSLQRHSVEFWSGGFQLFGQCFLNRILSLDPRKFERQLIYHVSNNKQRTAPGKKFIRVGDFYGQILRVKERAEDLIRTS